MDLIGIFNWGIASLLPLLAIYLILTTALNIQYGYAGIINFGVVAFFMVGAYASALLTVDAPGQFESYIGGWSLPIPLGWVAGMVAAAVLAVIVSLPVIRLREDFLAIATIAVAEILRSVANGVDGFLNRSEGIFGIPRPLNSLTSDPDVYRWIILGILLGLAVLVLIVAYLISTSPWGRTLRSLRDNDIATRSVGKNIVFFKLQSFIIGAAIMGLAGALYAHYIRAISPGSFLDLTFTFLVWTMLIVGGIGRYFGAVVGTIIVGGLWFGVNLLQSYAEGLDVQYVIAIRHFLIGGLIVFFILFRPKGIIPEKASVSRFIPRRLANLKKQTPEQK